MIRKSEFWRGGAENGGGEGARAEPQRGQSRSSADPRQRRPEAARPRRPQRKGGEAARRRKAAAGSRAEGRRAEGRRAKATPPMRCSGSPRTAVENGAAPPTPTAICLNPERNLLSLDKPQPSTLSVPHHQITTCVCSFLLTHRKHVQSHDRLLLGRMGNA